MAEKDIIIREWRGGSADSQELGLGEMRNVLIDDVPGAVTAAFLPTKESGTTITGLPTGCVRDPRTSYLYVQDDDGKLYQSQDQGDSWALIAGNTLPAAGAGGQGIALWKDYIVVARAAALDVYGPLAGVAAWTNSWQAIDSDTVAHPMLITPDDKLTGGAGRYVFTVQEATTFDPTSGGTYTFTTRALNLPAQYRIKCLAMLGLDLRIGTWVGPNLYDNKIADIFAWDRTSISFTGAKTLRLSENGVSQMIEKNGMLFIVAGSRNNVYVSNGSAPQKPKEFKQVDFSSGANVNPRPGGIMIHNNKLYTALSNGAGVSPLGVYSITHEGGLVLENVVSSGETTGLQIGMLFSVASDTYLIGWKGASAQGVDLVGKDARRVTNYEAYVTSPLLRVGTPTSKRTFSEIEFQIEKPLTTGTGVRLAYRTNTNASFSTIGTFDFATYGAITSLNYPASIADAENLQVRAFLTTYSSGIVSPILIEVRLR